METTGQTNHYRLHDLCRDYVRFTLPKNGGVGETQMNYVRRFADKKIESLSASSFRKYLFEDGDKEVREFARDNMMWHLKDAGMTFGYKKARELLVTLSFSIEWMEMRLGENGDVTTVLRDLKTVKDAWYEWEKNNNIDDDEGNESNSVDCILRQMRVWLRRLEQVIRTSADIRENPKVLAEEVWQRMYNLIEDSTDSKMAPIVAPWSIMVREEAQRRRRIVGRMWSEVPFMKSVGGAMLGVLKGHLHNVTSVAILNDPNKQLCESGLCAVSGSDDKTVRIWDATGREGKDGCLRVFKGHSTSVHSIAILNDPKKQLCGSGLCVVSGSCDHTVRIWDAAGREGEGGCLRVLKGHSDGVTSVAILNDAKNSLCKSGLCVVSCSYDKTVRIWDATGVEGKDGCLRVFQGHSQYVNSVAILNDPKKQLCESGLCVVSGSDDKRVRIWDATGRKGKDGCLRVIKGHSGGIASVTILNDPKKQLCKSGLCVVSGSHDETVRIWDVTGKEGKRSVRMNLYDNIGIPLDHTVRIRNSIGREEKDSKCLRVFKRHSSYVRSVAILNDPKKQLCKSGLCVVSCSYDKTVRIWDATGREGKDGCLRVLKGHSDFVSSVTILNDPKKQLCESGLCVMSGSNDNTVRIWNMTGKKRKDGCLRVFEGRLSFNSPSVAIFNDPNKQLCESGLCVVSGVYILDATGREGKDGCLCVLKGHSGPNYITSVAVLNDPKKQLCESGLCVVFGSSDHTVRIWDLRGKEAKGECVRFSPGTEAKDGCFRMFGLFSSEEENGHLRVFEGHSGYVNSVAILNDPKKQLCKSGLCVVSGSRDKTVRIWDATGKEGKDGCLRIFVGHSDEVISVTILNDSKKQLCKSGLCVVSCSYDNIRIWDATGREGKNGCLRVFKGHSRLVTSVAILNDPNKQLCKSGLCVVSGSHDETVRVWDATGRKGNDGCLRVFQGHSEWVMSVAILNDPNKQLCESGLCVVSGSDDYTVRIWDAVKSTCLYVRTLSSPIHSVHVLPVSNSIKIHYFDRNTSSSLIRNHNRKSLHCIALGLKSGATRVMYV